MSLNEIAFSGAEYADLIDNAIDHEDPDVPRVDPLKIPGISNFFRKQEINQKNQRIFHCIPLMNLIFFYFVTYFRIEYSGWEQDDYAELMK